MWYSEDGERWTAATFNAAWPGRTAHTSVVHAGRMWVMGGRYDPFSAPYNDVWWSTDGRHWTSATLSAEWAPRYDHASVSYQGKLWVIGGMNSSGPVTDTWVSQNGTSWTEDVRQRANLVRQDTVAQAQEAAVLDGILWVVSKRTEWDGLRRYDIGTVIGYDGREYYYPEDDYLFPGRIGTALISFRDRLWLIGGGWIDWSYHLDVTGMSDIWSSTNGTSWALVTDYAGFPLRYEHTAVATPDRIYVLGGSPYGTIDAPQQPMNDIWYTDLPPLLGSRNWESYR